MAKKEIQKRPLKLPADPLARLYKRNFLDLVICRFDFEPATLTDNKLPPAISKALKKKFPVSETQLVLNTKVEVVEGQVRAVNTQSPVWKFSTKDGKKTMEIANDHVVALYKSYESFDPFLSDFMAAAKAVFKTFSTQSISRIGLRYVDNFEFPEDPDPMDWANFVREDLLAWQRIANPPMLIARALQVVEYVQDDLHLKLQYGMPNPDYPAVIRRKAFVIDTDGYTAGPIEPDNAEDVLRKIRALIKTVFESLIKDGLRERMGVA